jgi:RNA polymerase sigma-70 factor, ECF subfamily
MEARATVRAGASLPTVRPPAELMTVAKHSEDLELVGRMLAGDEDAFESFGERCFKVVYRFALARLQGDRELTLEVVQTTMAKALAKLDTYRGEASLPTWLCSCCRNEMLMHFRRRRTAPAEVELGEVELEAELEAAPGFGREGNAEATLLRREEIDSVHLALDLLPEHYARALEWKYVERLPVAEIASRMGVQTKAAESLLTRARQAFRTSYEGLRNVPRLLRDTSG